MNGQPSFIVLISYPTARGLVKEDAVTYFGIHSCQESKAQGWGRLNMHPKNREVVPKGMGNAYALEIASWTGDDLSFSSFGVQICAVRESLGCGVVKNAALSVV